MEKIHCEYGKDYTLEIGYNKIVLDKLFGALIFCDLRVYPDSKTCEWVIERKVYPLDTSNSNACSCIETYWEEVCRIDAQESIQFE